MPRIGRIIVPNYPHYIVQKGTGGIKIFNNYGDRKFFLNILKKWLYKTSVKIWAYCLMNSHFHLLLVPLEKDNLAKCLHGLTFIYAQYFNSENKRNGRLWQNRYFSCPVDLGEHLWIAARYIERNPVRAGLVVSPEQWEWSSARYHIQDGTNIFSAGLSDWLKEEDRKDYSNFLVGGGKEEEIRKSTYSGRPFGSLEFHIRLG